MTEFEADLPLSVRHSLIANDEQGTYVTNRRKLVAEGRMEPLTERSLRGCQRMAVFGGFILGSGESEGFLVLSETVEDDGQGLVEVVNTGQIGLATLSRRNLVGLGSGRKSRDWTDVSAGCLAKELLGETIDENSIALAAAVEVYESPNCERIMPVFSYNNLLRDLVYRVRNNLPFGTTEDDDSSARGILEPTDEIKDALVIEAALDLLPEDTDEYYRI